MYTGEESDGGLKAWDYVHVSNYDTNCQSTSVLGGRIDIEFEYRARIGDEPQRALPLC